MCIKIQTQKCYYFRKALFYLFVHIFLQEKNNVISNFIRSFRSLKSTTHCSLDNKLYLFEHIFNMPRKGNVERKERNHLILMHRLNVYFLIKFQVLVNIKHFLSGHIKNSKNQVRRSDSLLGILQNKRTKCL